MKLIGPVTLALIFALGACSKQPTPEEIAASQESQASSTSAIASEAASKALSEATDPTGYLANGPDRKARLWS